MWTETLAKQPSNKHIQRLECLLTWVTWNTLLRLKGIKSMALICGLKVLLFLLSIFLRHANHIFTCYLHKSTSCQENWDVLARTGLAESTRARSVHKWMACVEVLVRTGEFASQAGWNLILGERHKNIRRSWELVNGKSWKVTRFKNLLDLTV